MTGIIKPLAVIPALAAMLLVAAACINDNNDNDEQVQALEQQVAEVRDSLVKQEVLYAYTALNAEGLHDMADAIQRATEIDTAYLGAVRRMHVIVATVEWPPELEPLADIAGTQLDEFAAALEGEDLAASKKEAPEAHLAWHNLDSEIAQFLGAGDGGHH